MLVYHRVSSISCFHRQWRFSPREQNLGCRGQPGQPGQVPQSLVPILTDALVKQISEESAASITLRQDTRLGRWSFSIFWCWLIFAYIGHVIIPTDELIFFRGVGQPPTRSSNSPPVSCGRLHGSHRSSFGSVFSDLSWLAAQRCAAIWVKHSETMFVSSLRKSILKAMALPLIFPDHNRFLETWQELGLQPGPIFWKPRGQCQDALWCPKLGDSHHLPYSSNMFPKTFHDLDMIWICFGYDLGDWCFLRR